MSASAPVISIEIDTRAVATLGLRINSAAAQVAAFGRGPVWSQLVAQIQTYLSTVIERSMMEFGGLKEGQSATVRGVEWKGWAQWNRKAYGGVVTEGTRYRVRKTPRGSVAKATGRTWERAERKAMMSKSVADRTPERVWKQRAGGTRFSESSKLMQDTGQMRQRLFLVDVRITGNTIELRPGAGQVHYFAKQNEMRPMWFLESPKDDAYVADLVQKALDQIMKGIEGGSTE